ncbi:MAG: hypothetical protein WHV44_12870 [Anaerolineales bacterium]
MKPKRREKTYLVRIWQEPSTLLPPGEWRGSLRQLHTNAEHVFKTPEDLWAHLTDLSEEEDDSDAKPVTPA